MHASATYDLIIKTAIYLCARLQIAGNAKSSKACFVFLLTLDPNQCPML